MALSANDLQEYRGITPLFPLPNFVMLPHVVKPFHMFEPRYRQLTVDALAADRFITIAAFEPGWEADYEGTPALRPIACLTRIINHQETPEGTYNLLVRGICRVRLGHELLTPTLYRQARAEPIVDPLVPVMAATRDELTAAAMPWVAGSGPAKAQLQALLNSNMNLGAMIDVIGFALPVSVACKQQLLEALDVVQRYQLLLEFLRAGPEGQFVDLPPPSPRRKPPDFSNN